MRKNSLSFVFLVLLNLFKGVEASIGIIIGYIILALVILCVLACAVACLCGGFCACLSEATRSHTGTTTINRLATVQEVRMVSSRQQLGANPEDLLTVSSHGPQLGPFAAVLNSGERPLPTAPPLEAEPPPQYPGDPGLWRVEPPPPYSEVEPPPPYS